MNPMAENHFDSLSDDLLHCIFNKVLDVKTLCRCLSVSKRFASIVPQTDAVSLSISPHKDTKPSRSSSLNFLKILIHKFISKPFQFLHHIIVPNSVPSSDSVDDSYYSPNEGLKSFNEIRSLHIQLPCHADELGSDRGDSLLRWKAEFGSELESCVILGATSFQRKKVSSDINGEEREEREQSESLFTNDELKLRVVWTISSLIAASARHYLLKQIVMDRPMLRSAVIIDANKQGRLRMREEQIVEMRNCMKSSASTVESSLGRTQVPALKMKLWYEPELEMPAAGWVMKGATLVVIRTVDGMNRVGSTDGDLLENAFDGEEEDEKALCVAVREIMKKKTTTCMMEMDSF